MEFIKICVNRPVTVIMGMLILVSIGITSMLNINQEMMPKIEVPIISVTTRYEGVGALEIESLITSPLEKVLSSVSGVKNISSTSANGISNITINFENGFDIDLLAIDVREKIALIEDYLPDRATAPIVNKFDMSEMNSIVYGITGINETLEEIDSITKNKIVPALTKISGVGSVEIYGGTGKEIVIKLDEEKIRDLKILENTIRETVMINNLTVPVGSIRLDEKNLPLRINKELKSIQDFENIVIKTMTGEEVLLSEISSISEEFKKEKTTTFTNGKKGVVISINKQSNGSAVEVSKKVKVEIEKLIKENENISIDVIFDSGDFVKKSIAGVSQTAIIGMLVAVAILFIFLGNIKTTLIIGLSMPISIIITFIFMYYNDVSLNIISLGGLTLGVGMLVDNSIVVIENIYRKIEEGIEAKKASIEGTKEVFLSIFASTVTTVIVFLPITFVDSVASDIFTSLAFTITFSLLSSLLISVTFVPMVSAFLFSKGMKLEKKERLFDKGFNKFKIFYKSILEKALHRRKTTYLVTFILILATTGTIFLMGSNFFPTIDEGMIMVTAKFPNGTDGEQGEIVSNKIVDIIGNYDDIAVINSIVYKGNTAKMDMYVKLAPIKDRDRSGDEIKDEIKKDLKDIQEAEINIEASASAMGSMGDGNTTILIKGRNIETLEKITKEIITKIDSIKYIGIGEPISSIDNVTGQGYLYVDEEKAKELGVNTMAIPNILSTAVSGIKATTYKTDGTELDVIIKGSSHSLSSEEIKDILIPTMTGGVVGLGKIAKVEVEDVQGKISRINQERFTQITIPTGSSNAGEVIQNFEKLMEDYELPKGYSWEIAGTSKEMIESFKQLGIAIILSILLVYMVMAANFESFKYPFIVMFSIPVAVSTALFGMFLVGEQITMTTFIGVIMLSGIVINNAIVLIDYANLLIRKRGYKVFDGLVEAGTVRLRPILMSTLTTVLGLIPMMFSTNEGAEAMRSVAITVMFGLSFSTAVTLVLIPVVYLTIEEMKNKSRNLKI